MNASELFIMAYAKFESGKPLSDDDFSQNDIREYRNCLLDVCRENPNEYAATLILRGAGSIPLSEWKKVMIKSRQMLRGVLQDLLADLDN